MAHRGSTFLVLTLLALTVASAWNYGVDFIDPLTTTALNCFRSSNKYIVTRIFHDADGGGCDAVGGNSIKLAANSNYTSIGIGAYIFPNPGSIVDGKHSAADQVNMGVWCGVAAGLKPNMFSLDIEVDPNHPWPSCTTSADYIEEMIATVWTHSDVCTVYTSAYEWQRVTCQTSTTHDLNNRTIQRLHQHADAIDAKERKYGSGRRAPNHWEELDAFAARKGLHRKAPLWNNASAAAAINSVRDDKEDERMNAMIASRPHAVHRFGKAAKKTLLLWYANYDGVANFADFSPFGPFKGAFSKQYQGNQAECGIGVDYDVSY